MAKTTVPTRVDFVQSVTDFRVLELAALGRPAEYIALATGLTVGQVRYRINRRALFKLTDIRRGTDRWHFARVVESDRRLRKKMKQRIKHALTQSRIVINDQMQ